jgi:chromosome segregation ATPase
MVKKVKNTTKNKDMSVNDLAVLFTQNSKKLEKHIDTSIEKLAIITAKGFASVDARFDRMENRMDGLDSRMGSLETRVEHIEETVMSLDSKLEEVNRRLKKVEDITDPVLTGYRIMQSEMKDLNVRVSVLERRAKISK